MANRETHAHITAPEVELREELEFLMEAGQTHRDDGGREESIVYHNFSDFTSMSGHAASRAAGGGRCRASASSRDPSCSSTRPKK